jgi:hypothetical protein
MTFEPIRTQRLLRRPVRRTDNTASAPELERSGFVFEGHTLLSI